MRIFVTFVLLYLVSCANVAENKVQSQNIEIEPHSKKTVSEDQVYSTVKVNRLLVTLFDHEGRCTLTYRQQEGKDEQRLDLGIESPCDFLRARWKNYEPLSYTYQEGDDRRTVILITGGPPHPTVKDQFQPNGCGTSLSKIRVFSDRIELAWSDKPGPPVCPSEGLDEVNYAT